MSIDKGERVPQAQLTLMGESGPKPVDAAELMGEGTTVLFAVPGAFTPTCSAQHLPGYIEHADAFAARGVDRIVCMAVNDIFVMDAWGKAQNAGEILMLGDGNGDFTRALGLELDGTGFGLGMRSQRFAMIVDDGVVTHLGVEAGPGIEVSAAEAILAHL